MTLKLDLGNSNSLPPPLECTICCLPFPQCEPFSRTKSGENNVALRPPGRTPELTPLSSLYKLLVGRYGDHALWHPSQALQVSAFAS